MWVTAASKSFTREKDDYLETITALEAKVSELERQQQTHVNELNAEAELVAKLTEAKEEAMSSLTKLEGKDSLVQSSINRRICHGFHLASRLFIIYFNSFLLSCMGFHLLFGC